MKKVFLFLLIVLPIYIILSIYSLDRNYFLCPIEYQGDMRIRCDGRGDGFFGARRNGRRLHEGLDLFADINTPVLAARSGVVTVAKRNFGLGNFIILQHTGGIRTIYGHLSLIYVRRGEFVRQGQLIGTVGKTGNANYRDIQPHLHFEIRKVGVPQDPLQYLE